jgi:hypothetical protein
LGADYVSLRLATRAMRGKADEILRKAQYRGDVADGSAWHLQHARSALIADPFLAHLDPEVSDTPSEHP